MPVTVGLGLGVVGSIGKLFSRGAANKRLRDLEKTDPTYTANPIAANRLAMAQTLLNARQPGAITAERNIYSGTANANAGVDRNATSAADALFAKSNNQMNQNNAFGQLGQNEANDFQRRYGNYTSAQEGQINEGDKVYQDSVRRFGDRAQIQGAISNNNQQGWGEFSNLGFGIADYGINGGFGGGGEGSGGGGGWQPPRQGFNGSGRATGVFP